MPEGVEGHGANRGCCATLAKMPSRNSAKAWLMKRAPGTPASSNPRDTPATLVAVAPAAPMLRPECIDHVLEQDRGHWRPWRSPGTARKGPRGCANPTAPWARCGSTRSACIWVWGRLACRGGAAKLVWAGHRHWLPERSAKRHCWQHYRRGGEGNSRPYPDGVGNCRIASRETWGPSLDRGAARVVGAAENQDSSLDPLGRFRPN